MFTQSQSISLHKWQAKRRSDERVDEYQQDIAYFYSSQADVGAWNGWTAFWKVNFLPRDVVNIYIYVKLLYDMELYHVIPPNIWLYSGERSPKATLDRKSSWWRHRLKECKIVFHICHLRFRKPEAGAHQAKASAASWFGEALAQGLSGDFCFWR